MWKKKIHELVKQNCLNGYYGHFFVYDIIWTYLWIKQKVRDSVFDLNSEELFLISRREGTKQQAIWGTSLKTQLDT